MQCWGHSVVAMASPWEREFGISNQTFNQSVSISQLTFSECLYFLLFMCLESNWASKTGFNCKKPHSGYKMYHCLTNLTTVLRLWLKTLVLNHRLNLSSAPVKGLKSFQASNWRKKKNTYCLQNPYMTMSTGPMRSHLLFQSDSVSLSFNNTRPVETPVLQM